MNQTSRSDRMDHLRTLPPPARPPAQLRIESLADLLVVASACTLETLPIFCWLLMLAAYDTRDPNNAAMPFWWMWLLVFGVRWIGVFFTRGTDDDPRRRRRNTLLLTLTVAVLGPLTLLATYLLSPAVRDFLSGGSDASGAVAVALLVTWLWIRGLLLGRSRITRELMYRHFIFALGVTVAALAGAAAVQGAIRGLTASYLSLLLAVLLFAGPLGLALAQARDVTFDMRSAIRGNQPMATPPIFTRSWLAASLGMSAGLSLLALLLATAFSRDSVRVLAIAAGNIMNGLISAVEFVLTPVFVLLYVILNKPVEWLAELFHGLKPNQPAQIPPPPQPCGPTSAPTAAGAAAPTASTPCVLPAHTPITDLLPAEWLTVMRWGTVILIVVVTLVLLARALNRFTDVRRVRLFSEERTMLDAREILGGQLRRFFGGLRHSPQTVEPAADALVAGSVRRVYRDMLAAAAATGHPRRDGETPREYQRRVTSDDPLHPGEAPPAGVAGAISTLTHSYEQARYGQPDPEAAVPAAPDTVNAAEVVRRWLTGQSRE